MADNCYGTYLRALREAKGKTLRETARALPVSPQFLSDVELGNVGPFNLQFTGVLVGFLGLTVLETMPLTGLARLSRLERAIRKAEGE